MATASVRERDLYEKVARYMRRTMGCSDTALDTGLQLGRIDVMGVRGIGGDLSGACETIAVEVKAGRQPFATSAGQAHGYSVYAHRCYLADIRDGKQPFTGNEVDIASRLGIGLLAIRSGGVREVLSAPRNEPIERLNLEILERLAYARCTICGSLFKTGTAKTKSLTEVSRSTSRGAVLKAAREERGFVYWLEDPSIPSLHVDQKGYLYNRRYLCRDCVANLFGELVEGGRNCSPIKPIRAEELAAAGVTERTPIEANTFEAGLSRRPVIWCVDARGKRHMRADRRVLVSAAARASAPGARSTSRRRTGA